ncbi:unnamed protein product [Trypanosoma congolense IL3000]|uniref:WGS project CAEQ00000000 data, annotated contig 1594 n=1 Tax=Trypanosoma congolense (strain IL3000) TaxID=1068625 RepID=F9W7E1_TRYCI|nr:unnamed protein product [Trypanosoma congolense IL3000]
MRVFLRMSGKNVCHSGFACSHHAMHTSALLRTSSVSPINRIMEFIEGKDYEGAVRLYQCSFRPDEMSLQQFCGGAGYVRDTVLCLMRAFTELGRMDRVREVFMLGLRSLERGKPQASLATAVGKEDTTHQQEHVSHPSMLNASFFNAYLEVLTRRKNFSKDEVSFILKEMKMAGVDLNALTYHYLIELHIRMGVDPISLWNDMRRSSSVQPLPCTVHSLLLHVVPSSHDPSFVVDVTRAALRCGSSVMDKKLISELMEQWLRNGQDYPPEYVLWLMFELELRCVVDKVSFVQFVQKQHVAELLQRCAKCADAETAAKALAMMDRHVMAKTADILSIVVWCWAQALELEKAFDLLELMSRKGYLDLTDPFKKYTVDCLRQVMDRHFMMALADAMSSPSLIDRVLSHLRSRRQQGYSVSVHSLDLVVLAAAKLGEDRRAMAIAGSYVAEWGVQQRTNTFNCLLVGLSTRRNASLQRVIYDSMQENGVSPNAFTFRVLIRQAVLADSIDEAIEFLQKVTSHTGLRVEVEMVLPILERAARVGDSETVNRISKFALDCDIGIDSVVLNNVVKLLTDAGQDVEVIKGHQPLHEALRSRSKVGRQRARNDIAL